MLEYQKQFIEFSLNADVLKFGKFTLKSGRISPYFFNSGLFNSGDKLARLGEFYAQALIHSEIKIDMMYGPAYKGIPLVSATSIAYAKTKQDIPYAFNRKEAKDHGEGGNIVGTPLSGRVLIIDDVITAGTSITESVEIIKQHQAEPTAVLVALDRQEKTENGLSALDNVRQKFNIPVFSIISFDQIAEYLNNQDLNIHLIKQIEEYRIKCGIEY